MYVILILQFTSPRLRLSDLIKKSLYFASMTQLDSDSNQSFGMNNQCCLFAMRLLHNDMDQISLYYDVYNYFHHFMLDHIETTNA